MTGTKKIWVIVIALLSSSLLNAQNAPARTGKIKVEVSCYYFKRNKNSTPTKKKIKTNNSEYYFSENGDILEEILSEKNIKYKNVTQYFYNSEDKLIESKEWKIKSKKKTFPTFHTKCFYDNSKKLIQEITYREDNSILIKFDYEYLENEIITKIENSQTLIRQYDEKDRIISKKQLWDKDTKIGWITNYSYESDCITEFFDSYDNNRKDYSKKRIECYENKNLVEVKEFYVDKDGLNEKVNFFYDSSSILQKLEYRYYSTVYKKYEYEKFIEIKVRGLKELDDKTIRKVNNELLELLKY